MKKKRKIRFKQNETGDARTKALEDMTPRERTILKSEHLILKIKDYKPEIIQI